MVDHSHWPETMAFMKRNWFWLSGAGAVIYYSIKWSVMQIGANILANHPTHEELLACQKKVTESFSEDLKAHEKYEMARLDRAERNNKMQFERHRAEFHAANQHLTHSIERVEDKINMIISKLLDK